MGVEEDINEFSPTVILPRKSFLIHNPSEFNTLYSIDVSVESHCSDLYSHRATDTPEMTASKERISELVLQWLGLSL